MNLVDRFVRNAEQLGFYILGAKVTQGGETLGEWSRFAAKPRFETYSVAKSFTGVAVGMALEEGLIRMDERICESFRKESFDVASENALGIRVRDLLTMTAGLSQTMMWRDGYERKHVRDWVRFFYTNGKFDNVPGQVFLYNNACPYMLGALIQKKSGQNVAEYLRYRLFEPIGIHNVEWGCCPMGRTIAANALSLDIDEMDAFGRFLLDEGACRGRQLVSADFIRAMLRFNMVTGELIPGEEPVNAGYGYQIWIDPVNRGAFMWGIFGQYCVVLPDKGAVVSVISLDRNDGGSNGQYETSPVRKQIWEDLVARV